MSATKNTLLRSLTVLAIGCFALAAHAETCSGFTWNVSKELQLFAAPAKALSGGKGVQATSLLAVDQLYDLALQPQATVSFAVAPEKKMLADGAFAGLARLQISTPGSYRISINEGFWIDVITSGAAISSKAFQGSPDCHAPRKIVEYELPATDDLLIQFSGATSDHVRVTVTRSPN